MTNRRGSEHTNNNMWSDDQRRDLSIYQAGSCLRLYIADDQESKDSAFNLRSPEDYHQITAALESHALALGWIGETRATFESGALVTDKPISQQEAVVLLQREIAPGITSREAITGEKRTVGTSPKIIGLIEGQHRMQEAVNNAADALIAKLKAQLAAKNAEIAGLKRELAQAKRHADHSDWLAGNFSDQMESFQAEAGDANDKMETLRTTIEQWKREAESNLAIVKSKPHEEGEDMYNRSLDGEALILRVERDAYDKVLRLLTGDEPAGEGEGGGK